MWIDKLNELALLPRAQQYSALQQLRASFTGSREEQWNTAFGPDQSLRCLDTAVRALTSDAFAEPCADIWPAFTRISEEVRVCPPPTFPD